MFTHTLQEGRLTLLYCVNNYFIPDSSCFGGAFFSGMMTLRQERAKVTNWDPLGILFGSPRPGSVGGPLWVRFGSV
jgi:hypothetical protein